MIKVLFFAQLRETLDCAQLEYTIDECGDIEQLKALLVAKGDRWQSAFSDKPVLVAVNQTMTTDNEALQDGDEVAFFPPVTGG